MQHHSGKWPTLEELNIACEGMPMSRQLEKSVLDRVPSSLEKIVKKLIAEKKVEANNYMPLIRGLTSTNTEYMNFKMI